MSQKQTTTLEVERKVAQLVSVYCKLNNVKMKEFTTRIINEHLKEFEVIIKRMQVR